MLQNISMSRINLEEKMFIIRIISGQIVFKKYEERCHPNVKNAGGLP